MKRRTKTESAMLGRFGPTGESVRDKDHGITMAKIYLESHPLMEHVAVFHHDRPEELLLAVYRDRFNGGYHVRTC